MWKLSFVIFVYVLVTLPAQILSSRDDNGLSLKLQIPKISRHIKCPSAYYMASELFPLPCVSHDDCRIMGSNYFCCPFQGASKQCAKGVKKQKRRTHFSRAAITTSISSNAKRLYCPKPEDIELEDFPVSCILDTDCHLSGQGYLCCQSEVGRYCTVGIKNGNAGSTDLVADNSGLFCPNPKNITLGEFPARCLLNTECHLSGQGYLCCQAEIGRYCVQGVKNDSTNSIAGTSKASSKATTSSTTTTTPVPTVTTTTEDLLLSILKPKPSLTLACPAAKDIPFRLFRLPCMTHKDCILMGKEYICCKDKNDENHCAKGIKKTKNKSKRRIPTLNTDNAVKSTEKSDDDILYCPYPSDIKLEKFPVLCIQNSDCYLSGQGYLCCQSQVGRYCTKGVKNDTASFSWLHVDTTTKGTTSTSTTTTTTTTEATTTDYTSNKRDADNSIEIIFPTSTEKAMYKPPKKYDDSDKHLHKVKSECPVNYVSTEFFPLPCSDNDDCRLMGKGYICCPSNGNRQYCIKKETNSRLVASSTNIKNLTKDPAPPTLPPRAAVITTITTAVPITTTRTTTTATTTTTTTKAPTTKSATLATFSTLPENIYKKPTYQSTTEHTKKACPKGVRPSFLAMRCNNDHDECKILGNDFLCCKQICVQGVDRPKRQQQMYNEIHAPLLGLLPRECPQKSFGEMFFPSKSCNTDTDCWPRICCPDGDFKYCKTPMPRLDMLPITKGLQEPFNNLAGFVQCSRPSKQALSRECNTSLDCFPNLCCQEGKQKFCRPPDKSFIGFIAGSAALASADRIRNMIPGRNSVRR